MNIGDVDTPAVLIDLDIMERNLRQLATYCGEHRLDLRPHTKTHKIPEIAHRQVALGAAGITVAKVGEAEVMADAGLNDILIAYGPKTRSTSRDIGPFCCVCCALVWVCVRLLA
jgi:D-serine deaminase-like pyridoxal phosphate-dependent protein